MSCESLQQGMDFRCLPHARKYYQQLVLVNRADILNKRIVTSSTDIEGVYHCANRVFFNLKEGLKGFRFSLNENASAIFGNVDKSIVESIPQYSHGVSIVIMGVDESIKCLLSQLDYGDYFAALQYYDNTIEIFGFEFGLSTINYNYDPHNSGGGSILRLASLSDSLEDNLPFIYRSTEGTEVADFDNNFENVIFDINGDFNVDFNDDFNNQD